MDLLICVFQEMIYVWNGFAIIGRNPELLGGIFPLIEESINYLVSNRGESRGWVTE